MNRYISLFEEIFLEKFSLEDEYMLRSVNTINKNKFNRIISQYPMEYWHFFSLVRNKIVILLDQIVKFENFLKNNVVDFTPQEMDIVVMEVEDYVHMFGYKFMRIFVHNQFVKVLYEPQESERLRQSFPYADRVIWSNNMIEIPFSTVKPLAQWFIEPFPEPYLSEDLSWYKIYTYTCNHNIFKIDYEEMVETGDDIIDTISLQSDGARSITNFALAYHHAYELYYQRQCIVESIIPKIASLGVMDYIN